MSEHVFKRQTLVSVHCADSDIERTYPAVQMAINGCKETTIREMVGIKGVGHEGMRENGFNLIGGTANSMRFATKVLRLPTQDTMLDAFMADNYAHDVMMEQLTM